MSVLRQAQDERVQDEREEIVWQGRFITTKTKGKWEYVSRARGIKAAVILAIDDGPFGKAQDRHVLLVEQFRVPLGRNCLELPAGLIGDEDADEEERGRTEEGHRERPGGVARQRGSCAGYCKFAGRASGRHGSTPTRVRRGARRGGGRRPRRC